MSKKLWAMPLRGHSAGPSDPSRFPSRPYRAAAVIAGELLALFVLILAILLPAIFGGS